MQNIETTEIISKLPPEQLSQLLTQLLQNQAQYQINRIEVPLLCQKHLTFAEYRQFTEPTLALYHRAHEYFKEFASKRGIRFADEVRYEQAEEFFTFLRKHPGFHRRGKLSELSILSMYKITKAMFALAEKRDYIIKNPFENKVYPTSQVTEWWTDDYVYKQLIPAIRAHVKPSNRFKTELKVRLTYTTGLRAGIIHRIRRKDVSINSDGSIYVNTKCKVQKSAKMQRVTTEILEDTTKAMMKEHIGKLDAQGINSDEKIFAKSQARTGYYNYRNTLRMICKKAGIRYLSPHKAKHGFITKMAKAGLSSRKICALTGNRTPSLIEQVYSHVEFEDVRETAREIINNTVQPIS